MTSRQRAEIQLDGLLNDPEVSLPVFIRRVTDNLSDDRISIEHVSKLLNAQPFIIERIVHGLYSSAHVDDDMKTLTKLEVQKLTRVLNGPIDVRTLLFFMMLDENNDNYVNYNELSEFYERYLKALKTFDSNRLGQFITVLSQKFHLSQVE
jgi:hypothetical protein